MREEELRLMQSTFGTNKEMEIDEEITSKLRHFGYPASYIIDSL